MPVQTKDDTEYFTTLLRPYMLMQTKDTEYHLLSSRLNFDGSTIVDDCEVYTVKNS